MNKALTIILTVSVVSQFALAAGAAKPAKGNRRVASRQVASQPNSGSLRTTGQTDSGAKEWEARIGLAGGFAKLNSSDGKEQAARDSGKTNNTAYGAVTGEVTAFKYFGAELEGYYGFGTTTTATSVDKILGTSTTTERKLKQYGGMADLQGRYAFDLGRVRVIPKAGAGFGILDIQSEGSNETKLTGLYAVGGVEVHLLPELYISGDYSRSITANGSLTASGAAASVDAADAKFDRIRAGAYYRVTKQFTAGSQYVRRTLSTTATAGTASTTETTNQFLAALLFNF
jgi:hypothetical protein